MKRRKYFPGKCDDGCIDASRVTHVAFWVNGFQMNLCARCVRGYSARLLKCYPGCLCDAHRVTA